MKRRERKGNILKDDGLINHAYKIYSLTIKDSIKEVSFMLRDSMMIDMRKNYYTNDII